MTFKLMRRLFVVLIALSLVAAACGEDDSADSAALERARAATAAAQAEAEAAQAQADAAAADADTAAEAAAAAEEALAAAMAEAESDEGVDPAVVADLEQQLADAQQAQAEAETRAEEAAEEAAEAMAVPTTTEAPEPAAVEGPTKMRVTSLGLCNEISIFWARDKGIFEANGLEVELIRTQGGSAGLAAIIGGAADAAFTNAFSTIIAYNQGFPISWIATAYNTTEAPCPSPTR